MTGKGRKEVIRGPTASGGRRSDSPEWMERQINGRFSQDNAIFTAVQ